MSNAAKRSKEPCSRCGAPVSVSDPPSAEIYCVDCRRKSKPTRVESDDSPSSAAIPLSGDDILTVVCQLCQSNLLVDESKVGKRITCPDCHSDIIVQRSKSRPKRNTGRPRPESAKESFDPDAELSLEEPADRPQIDPTFGLDEVTEDLLSSPLPEPETPVQGEAELSSDADAIENESSGGGKALTRRQRYEKIQKRIISSGRQKMRERAREKKSSDADNHDEAAADGSLGTAANDRASRKRRRRNRNRGDNKSRTEWVRPAFGWFLQPSMVVGWLLATAFLSVAYSAELDWSPIGWLDRWYVMLTQSPIVLNYRMILNFTLFAVGSVCIYYVCGRVFASNAQVSLEAGSASEVSADVLGRSSLFTTMHFSFVWLLAGSPFFYWSILLLPVQFLLAPPLLVGSWINGSFWKVVRAEGLVDSDDRESGRTQWFRFYRMAAVAALCACLPAMMIHSGGWVAGIGCLVMSGLMIGMAGVCGWHCRELSNSLETTP